MDAEAVRRGLSGGVRALPKMEDKDAALLEHAEARVREGRTDEAIVHLREEIRSRAVTPAVHELYRRLLRQASDALEDHDALTATGYNLVRVGERSGKLASMLDSLARLYEEAGRNRMKRVLILLEPIAILVIGSMIGTIILGVILAITSANDLAV